MPTSVVWKQRQKEEKRNKFVVGPSQKKFLASHVKRQREQGEQKTFLLIPKSLTLPPFSLDIFVLKLSIHSHGSTCFPHPKRHNQNNK